MFLIFEECKDICRQLVLHFVKHKEINESQYLCMSLYTRISYFKTLNALIICLVDFHINKRKISNRIPSHNEHKIIVICSNI
jgi:hypothetical protein